MFITLAPLQLVVENSSIKNSQNSKGEGEACGVPVDEASILGAVHSIRKSAKA